MIGLLQLRGQVKELVEDLREQGQDLRRGYEAEHAPTPYESWLEDVLDRAAVAWVLGALFVRFCEDTGLIRQRFASLPEAFAHLAGLAPTAALFDQHNPVWRFAVSPRAADRLVAFLRTARFPSRDTRLLGDFYQGLSSHARQTYALVQTPGFVEDLILDRTLEPAVREVGLAGTRVVDPACGAGHFLVGAFRRLLDRWTAAEPGTDPLVLTRRALAQVTGVDLDPVAVAIARFRLTVAALAACGHRDLATAPRFDVRLLAADALLSDDDLLRAGQYPVVVGNPPYKTVRDQALSGRYRARWPACSGKYALTVPFCQLFFRLATPGGHVGQITANSFMRREFGRKLVTGFLTTEVELTEVIDTSGAYLPGHGTPTVILIGRNRPPGPSAPPIRTVLGVRGEPGRPADPARGHVWSAIVGQLDKPGSESEWVTVVDTARARLARHPWSLAGGGAERLMARLDALPGKLGDRSARIGVFGMTNADDVLVAGRRQWLRRVGELSLNRRLVAGDELRDWGLAGEGDWAFFPYDPQLRLLELPEAYDRWLWRFRTVLGNRATFRRSTYFAEGKPWHSWHQITADPGAHPWWITYAFVATHNHFALDRGGSVFKQSAPVIKLPAGATEDDHLGLLGVLNSSAACFWLKQVSHNKGSTVDRRGARQTTLPWENFYEFGGTKLGRLPLPHSLPLTQARELDDLGRRLAATDFLAGTRADWESLRARMIAVQEELDWAVYAGYGLPEHTGTAAPDLRLGERAFEIVLARRGETQWFARHGSVPVTSPPAAWPADYRALVERRIAVIESDRAIGLLERPEHKRRWGGKDWIALREEALREWLLDRLEAGRLWDAGPMPVPLLAARALRDDDFGRVLTLWNGNGRRRDPVRGVARLVGSDQVPLAPEARFTASGLRKRAQWEHTWELQRRADAGTAVKIPVPPRYRMTDYRRLSYWRLRGRLDVPHERFTTHPDGTISRTVAD